ncbi:MAG: sigma-70 family RNA polymerase sigma factor [Segetibacter sp.]
MLNNDELIVCIKGCKQNNRESQKKMYASFYGFAMSVCFKYTSNKEDAIETVNDGFLKIFKYISNYEASYTDLASSFASWFKKIMINTAIDRYRKDKNLQLVNELGDESGEVFDKGEDAIEKISHDEIMKAVQNLSPGYRVVFNLYVIDGMTHKEIGEYLNITEGTSKSNLSKARKILQKDIAQSYSNY